MIETRFQTERSIRDMEYRLGAQNAQLQASLAGQTEFMLAQALSAAQGTLAAERTDRQFSELGGLLKQILDKLP